MIIRVLVLVFLFLISIPIGLGFLLYDNTYSFRILFRNSGFWWSWVSSTGCTLMVLSLVEYGIRVLERFFPWQGIRPHPWITRLAMQLLIGLVLPMALLLAWTTGFLVSQHATLNLESYIDSEFLMAALLMLVFNAVCCIVLVLWPVPAATDPVNVQMIDDGSSPPESPKKTSPEVHPLLAQLGIDPDGLEQQVSHILVRGRNCFFYLNALGFDMYQVAMDALEKALPGDHFIRTHRNDIVCWQAIADVVTNLKNHSCKILLKAPYEDKVLSVGPNYMNGFLAGWKTIQQHRLDGMHNMPDHGEES